MTDLARSDQISARAEWAGATIRAAGEMARDYFERLDQLDIESKGQQDFVTEADRNVETLIRERIGAAWPQDGIVGEEYPDTETKSGFRWVIDPIDGTASFVRGLPAWCVVIALTDNDETVAGLILDPMVGELFFAVKGQGATLNGRPLRASTATALDQGSVAVGVAPRVGKPQVTRFIAAMFENGGMFFRNGSGALMLAYVAAGRLLGIVEPAMYAWDCVAGMLLVTEAGGTVNNFDGETMRRRGGRVVGGGRNIYPQLAEMADATFDPED